MRFLPGFLGLRRPASRETLDLYEAARQAYERGDCYAACTALNHVLAESPQNAEAHNLLGAVHLRLQQAREAIAHFSAALEQSPGDPAFLSNKGHAHATLGEFETAMQCHRDALSLDPGSGQALLNWVGVGELSDQDFRYAETLGKRILASGKTADCIHAYFSLGKLYDDRKRYADAFDHFSAGNSLKRSTITFDIAKVKHLANHIKSRCSQESLSTAPIPVSSASPLFVLGMPRSGSTLLEQLLAKEFDCFPGGEQLLIEEFVDEISALRKINYPDWLPDLPLEDRQYYAAAYSNAIFDRLGVSDRVVDKFPFNFWHIGFIRLLFGRPTIIEVTRDPIDTCLSCYFTCFTFGNEFSYDIDELAQYYAVYQDLMRHWKTVTPQIIHEVNYREMVENRDHVVEVLRRVFATSPGVSGSQRGGSPMGIFTASYSQARRPIYRNSLDRWRRYGNRIAALREALLDAGVNGIDDSDSSSLP